MLLYNRLTLHHTGGTHKVNSVDRRAYHEIVDGDGVVHQGNLPVDVNAIGRRLTPGSYYPHTAMCNGGNFGLSMACMGGHSWSSPRMGSNFPTLKQANAFIQRAAEICVRYNIPVKNTTVLTHAEVEPRLGIKQKNKWDFDYDIFASATTRDPLLIGDMLRSRISHAIDLMDKEPTEYKNNSAAVTTLLRRGSSGYEVQELQELLNSKGFKTDVDSMFGPDTYRTVKAFQKAHQLVEDGVVGPATWESLYE